MAAMLEDWMAELCLDTAEGVSPYPVIDDHKELEDGAVVFATVKLNKDDAKQGEDGVEYALPGIVGVGADGVKTVKLFDTVIWERLSLSRVETVTVDEQLQLRRGAEPVVEEEQGQQDPIKDGYVDPIGEVVETCRNQVMSENGTFKKYIMAEGKEKMVDKHKWSLLREITVTMASRLTTADYAALRPDQDAPTTAQGDAFRTNYITPAITTLTSECEDDDERKDLTGRITKLRKETTMKYACMIMDVVVAGPKDLPKEPKGADSSEDMAKINSYLTKIWNKITVLEAVNRMSSTSPVKPVVVAGKLSPDAKARILKVLGDGRCAYATMEAGGAKARDPDAKLDLGPKSHAEMNKRARKRVGLGANLAYKRDEKDFEVKYGPWADFFTKLASDSGDSDCWPEFAQWKFYSDSHEIPPVEYRIKDTIKVNGAIKIKNYSTWHKDSGEPQPAHVMFPWYQNKSHFDIAAVESQGKVCYVFPAAEADAAEALIDAFILNHKKPMRNASKNMDQEECALLLDGLLGLGDDDSMPLPVAENKNVQKRKQEADRKAKAAAALQNEAKKAQADAEARMAKAAAKAAAELFSGSAWSKPLQQAGGGWGRNHGGGSRPAAPPSSAQPRHAGNHAGGGWGRNPGGGSRPAAPPPSAQPGRAGHPAGYVPGAIVFGTGSNRELRRSLKAMNRDVNKAVAAICKVETGAPRAILYCAQDDLDLVLTAVPLLKQDGFRCDAYKEPRKRGGGHGHGVAPPKADRANDGLRAASLRAGLCHYMVSGRDCPHNQRGQCKFICYDQQPQQRSPPRRQPSGWHR